MAMQATMGGTDREPSANKTLPADHPLTIPQPKPRPGVSAWGQVDPATGYFPVYTDAGLWFVLDRDCKEIRIERAVQPGPTREEYIAMLHDLADKDEGVGKCYFIGADAGPIKIGYSVRPTDRLRALQYSSPLVLRILALAPGGDARELAYHAQFAEHRLHGEWFERCPEILEEIERLK